LHELEGPDPFRGAGIVGTGGDEKGQEQERPREGAIRYMLHRDLHELGSAAATDADTNVPRDEWCRVAAEAAWVELPDRALDRCSGKRFE
jgi:hypothetical protein